MKTYTGQVTAKVVMRLVANSREDFIERAMEEADPENVFDDVTVHDVEEVDDNDDSE